jgi:hypothetical protein
MTITAVKVLSDNDLGLTKSHQAGFLIPKSLIEIGLFSRLTDAELNPRQRLKFCNMSDDYEFYVNYIFYNNKFFGGTRHEYRLTGLSKFIREYGLRPGDEILLTRFSESAYGITIQKKPRANNQLDSNSWTTVYDKGNTK